MVSVTDAPEHRVYGDLAACWPLISSPEEYAQEAACAGTLLSSASISRAGGSGAGQRRRPQRCPPQGALRDDPRRPLRRHARGVATAQPRVRPSSGRHAGGSAGPDLDAVFVHDAVDYEFGAAVQEGPAGERLHGYSPSRNRAPHHGGEGVLYSSWVCAVATCSVRYRSAARGACRGPRRRRWRRSGRRPR